jgi:two-component system, cell cycle response regulator
MRVAASKIIAKNIRLDDHVERVAELAAALAEALGQPEREVSRIRLAAKLHDIGKAAVPPGVLEKIGPLNQHDWVAIRRHPVIGEYIVMAARNPQQIAELIRASHERTDGQGYPDGLAGDDIPLGSRIIAVCDAFDAMTNDRAYRSAMSPKAALVELQRHSGTQFDVLAVAVFCAERHRASQIRPATAIATSDAMLAGASATPATQSRWS